MPTRSIASVLIGGILIIMGINLTMGNLISVSTVATIISIAMIFVIMTLFIASFMGNNILETQDTQSILPHCLTCGKIVPHDAIYCPYCGEKIDKSHGYNLW